MLITDKKMIELRDLLKNMGKIKGVTEFDDVIGIKRQNVYFIKNPEKNKRGESHFSAENIIKAVNHFNINANWIFGLSDRVFQ